MSTSSPRRAKCGRCDKAFVLASGDAALPAHDDANERPCPGSAVVELRAPVAVGDRVDAWLPPPQRYERAEAGDHEVANLSDGSRRSVTVLAIQGSTLRVRDEEGDEVEIDAADLGEAQPEWSGR